mgnify:CR=1 FL=1
MEKKTSYRPKTQLALDAQYSIGNANNILHEKIFNYVKTTGLTATQFSIINILGHKGSLKISEIFDGILIKSGNRTMIIDSLEERKLLKRIFSKNDRREIIIELTSEGEKFFKDNQETYSEFVEKTMSVLTQTEQKELNTLLNKLSSNL